jgi:hypothetical protein
MRRATFLIRSNEPTDVPPNFCTISAMRPGKSARFYRRCIAIALVACGAALAADPAYRLDLGLDMRRGTLQVEPTLSGPAGKSLRYEMNIRREGGGSSSSSQAGTVRLDGSGNGHFAYNALSVNKGDRYTVTVKVFDGDRLVAEQSAHQP